MVPLEGTRDALGLEQSRLGLRFTVSRAHFKNGEMTLKCSAKISSVYYKTRQHSVDGQLLTYHVPFKEAGRISAAPGE